MDGFAIDLGLPVFLLLATRGAYETVLKVLENLNGPRGAILAACRTQDLIGAVLPGVDLAEHILWVERDSRSKPAWPHGSIVARYIYLATMIGPHGSCRLPRPRP